MTQEETEATSKRRKQRENKTKRTPASNLSDPKRYCLPKTGTDAMGKKPSEKRKELLHKPEAWEFPRLLLSYLLHLIGQILPILPQECPSSDLGQPTIPSSTVQS